MSLATLSRGGLSQGSKSSRLTPPSSSGWVRPADWLALPAVDVGDQKFVGLVAIYPGDSNWVHIQAQGNYTIDWGDGTVTNYTGATINNHNYVYANHTGTECSRGYRQAVITITPQGVQNLTLLSLANTTRPTGMVSGWSSAWLDIKMAGSNVASLTVSSTTTRAAMLERFEYVGNSALTINTPNFNSARALQEVVGTGWTSGCTNFTSMFTACTALRTIPLLNTAAGTNFSSMFSGCSSLQSVPLLNTAAGTNFGAMFNGCVALKTIPLFDTAAGTDFSNMFSTCNILQTTPLLNTAAGTNFNGMFNACGALQFLPALNTAAATDLSNMFTGCVSLQSAPLAGSSRTISYASCKLKGSALDAIYTALATVNTNLLSANASSVETSAVDWATNAVNCAVLRVTAPGQFQDGVTVVQLTSTASGEATAAITTRIAVSASTAYTFMAYGAAQPTARQFRVKIVWHDAGGAPISTSTGSDLTSTVNGNMTVQANIQATSPVGAVTASVVLSWTATAGAQQFWFDKMGLFSGTTSTWQIGGSPTITVSTNWDVANDTPSIATAKGWTVVGS